MAEFTDKPGYSFNPGPPPDVARFFRNKSIRPSFSYLDVEPEEHAVQFAVAKAMNVDVLDTIKGALQKAIDEGVPYRQFANELTPRLRKLGWWGVQERPVPGGDPRKIQLGSPRRLKTIYRANMRSARAAGQWDRIQRTKAVLPYLVYLLGPSERHRPHHQSKAGLVLPIDDPFWHQWYPPNGWGCKCHVRQVTSREATDLGVSQSPPVPMRDVLNRRTGEIKRIPSGIDLGWQGNPGRYRQQQMERFLAEKLDSADPAIARVAAKDMATSWRMQRIFEGSAKGSVPIAMLPDDLASMLGSKTRVVQFSDYTAAKGLAKHPEATVGKYAALDDIITTGGIYRLDEKSVLTFTKEIDGRIWAAVVKATADKTELYLSTYYWVAARYAARHFTKKNLIREGK